MSNNDKIKDDDYPDSNDKKLLWLIDKIEDIKKSKVEFEKPSPNSEFGEAWKYYTENVKHRTYRGIKDLEIDTNYDIDEATIKIIDLNLKDKFKKLIGKDYKPSDKSMKDEDENDEIESMLDKYDEYTKDEITNILKEYNKYTNKDWTTKN